MIAPHNIAPENIPRRKEETMEKEIRIDPKTLRELRPYVEEWLRTNGPDRCPFCWWSMWAKFKHPTVMLMEWEQLIACLETCSKLMNEPAFAKNDTCPCRKYGYTDTVKALEEAIAELDKNKEVPNDQAE
jgi:hypothetical protein